MWAPVPFDNAFVCDFAIDGLDEPVRTNGMGVDSLQALMVALDGVRSFLMPHIDRLAQFDTPGEIGIPLQVTARSTPEQTRRLEAQVEELVHREIRAQFEPREQRWAAVRRQYDPDAGRDLSLLSRDELVAMLRAAAREAREQSAAGNRAAEAAFISKQWDVARALRDRADYREVLGALCVDDDRAVSVLAAKFLSPEAPSRETFERLRDEREQPEADFAARELYGLHSAERAAARPRPWDNESTVD